MIEIVALMLALWSMLGVDVQLHEVEGEVHFTDLYGEHRYGRGAVACPDDGPPQLWLSDDASPAVIVHELAHVLDCVDDGALNGSPTVRPPQRPAWASNYCWSSPAEWYACSVTSTGPLAETTGALLSPPLQPAESLALAGPAPLGGRGSSCRPLPARAALRYLVALVEPAASC